MRASNLLLPLLAMGLQSPSPTTAQQLPPGMTIGTDGPADAATTGFWTNHVGLNVANLTASRHFYGEVLGMRHIFTLQYTPRFSETYMGFAQGGRNGTGFQTGAELLRDKNNSGGLVKLLHFAPRPGGVPPRPSTRRTSTLANLGLIVPDVPAFERRIKRYGVTILKGVGETRPPLEGALAKAFNVGPASGATPEDVEAIVKGLMTTDLANVMFIEDPDGNVLEVVPQNGF